MSEPTETEQTSESKGIELTAAESKFVLAVMANLTSDIQFNADAIAAQMGYKDAAIVRARWNTIKRKKLSVDAPTGVVKKRTPKKAAKSKEGEEGDGDGGDDEEVVTPVKTPKKRTRKPKTAKADEEEPAVEEPAVKEEVEEA
ncbi:hypothetical protein LTR09_010001 [Extremus antarcticus]|uniref:Uncharacterized protein n=1 Tax=Extremus antarcticus TaxID=702011 RepID=A0AAJ0D808_9PEZI|nr:hypothetical protein LTR09_010001 [Extremus antarcticus]